MSKYQKDDKDHNESDRQRDGLISDRVARASSCVDDDGQTQNVWRDAEPLAESRQDATALPIWELKANEML